MSGGPEGERRRLLTVLLVVLTVLSGLVDAVSILSLGHVFVANMTGNLVFVSLGLAGAPEFSVVTSLVALGGFTVGILFCRAALSRLSPPVALVSAAALCETALLASATVLHALDGPRRVLVVVCAVAMGLQNAMAGRVGIAGLTTTVMTRTLVGLIGDTGAAAHDRRIAVRQALSVAALVCGALAGGLLVLLVTPPAALAAATGCALAVAATATVAARR
ncbi:YoaK family protein [Actinacidiphila glaucinigra]|uniref:YoaK family protein n=1 Tax=Actinacidiphila glaucinigra TaxID=235986 RepID=UPI002E346E51|nr:YoaK family protein [Actinacidiphila glaucinigra]